MEKTSVGLVDRLHLDVHVEVRTFANKSSSSKEWHIGYFDFNNKHISILLHQYTFNMKFAANLFLLIASASAFAPASLNARTAAPSVGF